MLSRARPTRLLWLPWLAALESATGCSDIVGLECESGAPCEKDGVAGTCIDGRCVADGGTTGTSIGTDEGSGPVITTMPDPSTTLGEETGGDDGLLCGNGIVDPGEECDDTDAIDVDECSNGCRSAVCGDGIVQTVEDCDLGPANLDPSSPCKPDCTPAICGDGVVRQNTEICDGRDFQGLTCEALGLGPGALYCSRDCLYIDTLGCDPCGMHWACDAFQPCKQFCEYGSVCFTEQGPIGTCLPPCVEKWECPLHPEGWPSICVEQLCVIPCDDQPCPDGMICMPSPQFGLVCLW